MIARNHTGYPGYAFLPFEEVTFWIRTAAEILVALVVPDKFDEILRSEFGRRHVPNHELLTDLNVAEGGCFQQTHGSFESLLS